VTRAQFIGEKKFANLKAPETGEAGKNKRAGIF
jgi:hypothetical protein